MGVVGARNTAYVAPTTTCRLPSTASSNPPCLPTQSIRGRGSDQRKPPEVNRQPSTVAPSDGSTYLIDIPRASNRSPQSHFLLPNDFTTFLGTTCTLRVRRDSRRLFCTAVWYQLRVAQPNPGLITGLLEWRLPALSDSSAACGR